MSETPMGPLIEKSVEFSFSDRNRDAKAIAARQKLEKRTEGFPFGLVKSAAENLAKGGIQMRDEDMWAMWDIAKNRAKKGLEKEANKGNLAFVFATLNEIDPCDVPVQNLSAKPGTYPEVRVRRSVGLIPGQKAYFREASPQAKFPDIPNKPEYINVGGGSFRKEVVEKTLDGKAIYQPMFLANGDVYIPLVKPETGELELIKVTDDQLKILSQRLGERKSYGNEVAPKNVQIEFGGQSDRGITRKDSPDEDSFFSGTKGQPYKLQLADARAHIDSANESFRKGQSIPNLKPEASIHAEKIRLAHASADKIFANGVNGLFIVADGMGGANAGETASQMAIQTTLAVLSKTSGWEQLPQDQIQQKIKEAVIFANKRVLKFGQDINDKTGSTITMAMVVGNILYTANVGDSRVYLYEEETDTISRLTKDHSLVERLVDTGMITDDQRYTHPEKNQIYRTLGDRPNVEVDVSTRDITGNVKILTACDGVWEMIRDPQLKDLLSQQKPSPEIVRDIILAANKNGGEDNITAVVAKLSLH